MTAVDKETIVTSVTFLSPNQQVNHTFKAKDEGTSTVQENHKTNVGENLNQGLDNWIRINWQLMIIILALLTVLTSTYFGKCVHRHWISRTFRVSISNTTPTIALGDINQTENSYDIVQTRDYQEPQRYQTTAGDAIGQNSDILNHENSTSPENMEAVSFSSENEPRCKKSLNWINTNKKDQYENRSDTRELNDLYITPCM